MYVDHRGILLQKVVHQHISTNIGTKRTHDKTENKRTSLENDTGM